jgi:hypothetical protein
MRPNNWSRACVLLLGATLFGCLASEENQTAGIEGTGSPVASRGSVTSYGSILVNGERIDISRAQIHANGELVMENAIELGMVVQVEAERDEHGTVVAERVHYRRALLGTVSEVVEATAVRKVLNVLGQTMVVHDDAHFAGITFDELGEGTRLDVSGFTDSEGRLVASRIALAAEGIESEVSGDVQHLNREYMHLQLRGLKVHYADAVFEIGHESDLANGVAVTVQGQMEGDVLVATRITFVANEPELEEGVWVSHEGVVRNVQAQAQFALDGVIVNAAGAELTGGSAEQLTAGIRVAVAGTLENGILQAQQVHLLLPGIYRVRAPVDDVDPQLNTIVIMGTTYINTRLTAFEDLRPNPNRVMNLNNIQIGDYVEVFARYRDEQLEVTRINRLSSHEGVKLRGPVSGIDEDLEQIVVMGVSVNLHGAVGAALIGQLSQGDVVEVRGNASGKSSIAASHLELPEVPDLDGCLGFFQDCQPALKAGSIGSVGRSTIVHF